MSVEVVITDQTIRDATNSIVNPVVVPRLCSSGWYGSEHTEGPYNCRDLRFYESGPVARDVVGVKFEPRGIRGGVSF